MKRNFLAIVVGWIVEVVLFFISVLITNAQNLNAWKGTWDKPAVSAMQSNFWLAQFVLVPLVVLGSSFVAALIAKRQSVVCALAVCAPLLLIYVILNSFDLLSLLVALGYAVISLIGGLLASVLMKQPSQSESIWG